MVIKMFFYLVALLPFAAYGQSVEVKKETSRIEGKNTAGYQVALAGAEEEVKASLTKYLKGLGKTKQSGDYITLAEPLIGGKKYSGPLFATTRKTGNTTSAWMGIPSENGEDSGLNAEVEKLVHDFGTTFQREKIQLQIDESLRALQAVEKKQSRLLTQSKDLSSKIGNNKRQKIQLEKSLEDNKVELVILTKRLEENKKAQDSVALATEQIKKVVEMHKEKQRQVH